MAKFCKHCGAALNENSKFCNGCGNAVESTQAASGQPDQQHHQPVSQSQTPYSPPVQSVYQQQNTVQQKKGWLLPFIIGLSVLVVALIVTGVIIISKKDGGWNVFSGNGKETTLTATQEPMRDPEQEQKQQVPEKEQKPEVPEEMIIYEGDETPTVGDFSWFTKGVKKKGLPKDRIVLTDFNAIKGFWKAYDEETMPMLKGEKTWKTFSNIEISGTAKQLKYITYMENAHGTDGKGKNIDMSHATGEVTKGKFSNGKLVAGKVSKGHEITISTFYFYKGKKYAIGKLKAISGEKLYIALVRP